MEFTYVSFKSLHSLSSRYHIRYESSKAPRVRARTIIASLMSSWERKCRRYEMHWRKIGDTVSLRNEIESTLGMVGEKNG